MARMTANPGRNREVALVAQGRPYGTPTTLTDALGDKIAKYVRMGDRPFVAAEISGVPRRMFYEWMEKGRADSLDSLDTIYAAFTHKIEAAEAWAEHRNVVVISTAARAPIEGDWKAAIAYLSRRRDGWQERKELTGKDGTPLYGGSGFEDMGDDEISERLDALQKRRRSSRRAARTPAPARTRTKARPTPA